MESTIGGGGRLEGVNPLVGPIIVYNLLAFYFISTAIEFIGKENNGGVTGTLQLTHFFFLLFLLPLINRIYHLTNNLSNDRVRIT